MSWEELIHSTTLRQDRLYKGQGRSLLGKPVFHLRPIYRTAAHCKYKLSKKRTVLSLSTAFIFSKLNMCKYLCEQKQDSTTET